MKKIFLFLVGISGIVYCQGVNFDWAGSMGQATQDEGVSIAVDQNGDVITVGYFSGTVDFDPSASVSNLTTTAATASFITKFDSDGNFIWAKKFDHTSIFAVSKPKDLAIDASGNLLITGNFELSLDMDPGAGVSILSSAGANDVFVCKLDNNGNYLWSARIGGSQNDFSSAISIDNLDNVCISGSFEDMVDFDPSASSFILNAESLGGYRAGYVCKLSSTGGFLWASDFVGTDESIATDIAVDSYNNVVVVGTFTDTVDFDPAISTFNIISNGSYDFFIVQLNSGGQLNYAYGIGDTGFEYDQSKIVAGESGSVFWTASFSQQIDLDPGPGVLLSTGFFGSMFMMKLNVAGQLQWVDEFPGAGGNYFSPSAIAYGDNNGVYLTGSFNGPSADFDPSSGQSYLMAQFGMHANIFTMKVDTMGDFIWAKSYGGTNPANSKAVFADNLGNVYTTGYFSDTIDVDPSPNNFDILSNGQTDAYIQKLKPCINTMDTIAVSSCYNYNSPSGNYTWYASGTYSDILPNNDGCDSMLTINLTILSDHYSNVNATICTTETYLSPSGNYTWNTAGTYYDTIPNAGGCDSNITINLSISSLDLNVTTNAFYLQANENWGTYQWLDCNNGNDPIPGATNQNFYPTSNGTYAVILNNTYCMDTSSCFLFEFMGMENININSINIYPNPVKDILNILYTGSISRIQIATITGEVVYSSNNKISTLDISAFSSGIYLLNLVMENQEYYFRVVKQ